MHDFFALHLDERVSPFQVAQVLGAHHEGQIGELLGHHIFSVPRERGLKVEKLLANLCVGRNFQRRSGDNGTTWDGKYDTFDSILWSQRLSPKRLLQKRLPPLMQRPETLLLTGQAAPEAVEDQKRLAFALGIADPLFSSQWHLFNPVQLGHDVNVSELWLEGITGRGVTIAVVDDGLDMYSNDLKENYYSGGSYDFNDQTTQPRPRLFDDNHGTRCAGEIAAARNNVCGIGIAYESQVSGIRLLSKPVDDAIEAAAVNYDYQHNDIYSCSWGPPDDGKTMEGPGILVQRAIVNGVQNGRGGKGSIFVFSAGNGGGYYDNCNFDGYANSIYSITVGAIDRLGKHAGYSESCSAQLAVAYSSGSGDAIYTTDVGANKCSSLHSGTSAAGPLVAGIIALALSIRPDLTWRDCQYLIVETAVPVHESDGSWQVTTIGKRFSHDWGYGKIDAYSLVQKAKSWQLVKPQAWFNSPWLWVQDSIPQGSQGLSSVFEMTERMAYNANFARVEHVTVKINVSHTRRGDLSVELCSPEGISLIDTNVDDHSGKLINWRLKLWGEAINGLHQPLHPFPDEHDQEFPGVAVAITSAYSAAIETERPTAPIDANNRPGNVRLVETGGPTPATSSIVSSALVGPASLSASFPPLHSWIPAASRSRQLWVHTGIIFSVVFCIVLGLYLHIKRRRL
ncbi:pheromone processing endoprotease [Aspergillus hancockii]|nr:pheromone processing endoprotease [Aspergillus hancockii]